MYRSAEQKFCVRDGKILPLYVWPSIAQLRMVGEKNRDDIRKPQEKLHKKGINSNWNEFFFNFLPQYRNFIKKW